MHTRKRENEAEAMNETAFRIVAEATGQIQRIKNPAAVALGKLGASKGGKARAKKLSKAMLVKIAKKAARARWGEH